MIQLERYNGGAPTRCQADDLSAGCAPFKMLAPSVAPRVEQAHATARERVACELLHAFELIAKRATEAEVFEN